jgi:hypothetical protein
MRVFIQTRADGAMEVRVVGIDAQGDEVTIAGSHPQMSLAIKSAITQALRAGIDPDALTAVERAA